MNRRTFFHGLLTGAVTVVARAYVPAAGLTIADVMRRSEPRFIGVVLSDGPDLTGLYIDIQCARERLYAEFLRPLVEHTHGELLRWQAS